MNIYEQHVRANRYRLCLNVMLTGINVWDMRLVYRYELREDRKRVELQTASHVESLRRDILRFVGSLAPQPLQVANSLSSASAAAVYPFTASGGGGGSTRHGHRSVTASRHSSVERDDGAGAGAGVDGESPVAGRTCANCGAGSGYPAGISGATAATDMDAVKREIAIGLRSEIRELVREVALVATGGGRNAVVAATAAMASPGSLAGGVAPNVGPGNRSAPPRLSTPSQAGTLGADLYQTHLYTQL